MKQEKAYILLAKQENISNKKAKELIDRGLVYAQDKKLKIARGLMPINTKFKLLNLPKPKKIFEDENIIVIDKPPYITSEEIAKMFNTKLLHRLDKETSGILVLVKNKDFKKKLLKSLKNKMFIKNTLLGLKE